MNSDKKKAKVVVRGKKTSRVAKEEKKSSEKKEDLWKSWLQKASQTK
jgi:hypothetical protein